MSVRRRLIITRGLPGSGKTFWAKRYVAEYMLGLAVRVSRDDLRAMGFDRRVGSSITEGQITAFTRVLVEQAWDSGAAVVVVDETNLPPSRVRSWEVMARRLGALFEVKDFRDVPLATCLERNATRVGDAFVPEDWIVDNHRRWVAPRFDKEGGK